MQRMREPDFWVSLQHLVYRFREKLRERSPVTISWESQLELETPVPRNHFYSAKCENTKRPNLCLSALLRLFGKKPASQDSYKSLFNYYNNIRLR